jgi:orotidine-5'-phosphate decarboxylase
MHFADRLLARIQAVGNPVLVGIDPRPAQLPPGFLDRFGSGRLATAQAFAAFGREVVEVVAPLVPAVKFQAAFYEVLGPEGMAALQETAELARHRGLIVILDGKRNDIGSTADAYAQAYLNTPAEAAPQGEPPACSADALTVNAYLGSDGIEPFVKVAAERGAGIFILVKTSNPGSKDFQDLKTDGRTIYEHVAAGVEQLSLRTAAGENYGAVGAVVGATWPRQLDELRAAMPHTWILVPGFGKQGGRAADVRGAFDAKGLGAIVVSARDVIFAHSRPEMNAGLAENQWQTAVDRACRDMIERLAADTPAGTL